MGPGSAVAAVGEGAGSAGGGQHGDCRTAADSRLDGSKLILIQCAKAFNEKPAERMRDDQMEVGLGIHGEPGFEKAALQPVAAIAQ